MADLSILGDVIDLIPDVTVAVDGLKAAKSDRESRGNARRLASQVTLFNQFTRKLLLLSGASSAREENLRQTVEKRLGTTRTNAIAMNLIEMQRTLRHLKRDLANTRHGTEILWKFDSVGEGADTTVPQTSPRRHLDELSRLNTLLAACLAESQLPVPFLKDFGPTPSTYPFFHEDREKLVEAVKTLLASCRCDCPVRHLVSLRCPCARCNPDFVGTTSWADGWTFEVTVHPVTQIQFQDVQVVAGSDNEATYTSQLSLGVGALANICKLRELATQENPKSQRLGKPELSNRTFSTLGVIQQRRPAMSRRDRMVLAFRLCSAVLQFANTPLAIDGPRGSKDWLVAIDSDPMLGAPTVSMLLRPDLFQIPPSGANSREASYHIAARDSTLVKLGLSLIELVLGRTLAEIRSKEATLFGRDATRTQNPELLDIFAAKRLLSLRYIAQVISSDFEDVVGACITQQYRDGRDGQIKEIDIKKSSFPQHATTAILMPLYEEVLKEFGTFNQVQISGGGRARSDSKWDRGQNLAIRAETKAGVPSKPTKETDRGHPSMSSTPVRRNDQSDYPAGAGMDAVLSSGARDSPALPRPPSDRLGDSADTTRVPRSDTEASDREHLGNAMMLSLSSENPRSSGDASQQESWVKPAAPSNTSGGRAISVASNRTERDGIESAPPSCYPETASGLSYATVSESIDSSFPWFSAQTHKLADGHPFLKLSKDALGAIFSHFRQWTEYGSGNAAESWPSAPPSYASSARKRPREKTGGSGRPLHNNNNNNADDEDDDGDDDDWSHRGGGPSRKKPRVKEKGPNFACPFLKRDPMKYETCCAYKLHRIRDVKQHLGRKHGMPIYCAVCHQTFSDEDKRDMHTRERRCTQQPHAKPEGISEMQKKHLARKPPPNQTAEQQWYGIFDILFPEQRTKPPSPYLNMHEALFKGATDYHQFLEEQGPQILGDMLTSRGYSIPLEERDLEAFLQGIFKEGIRLMFHQWAHQGQASASASESHPTTATEPTTQGSSEVDYGSPTSFSPKPASHTIQGPPHTPHLAQFSSPHSDFDYTAYANDQTINTSDSFVMGNIEAIFDLNIRHVDNNQMMRGDGDVGSFASSWLNLPERGGPPSNHHGQG